MSNHRGIAVAIEDDANARSELRELLSNAGFDVVTASDGFEGVDAVRRNGPLVTTVDLAVRGIDGIEVVKRIRTFSPTYIVLVTDSADESDVLEGLGAGADAYIARPFRPREFRARLEAILRRADADFLAAAAARTRVDREDTVTDADGHAPIRVSRLGPARTSTVRRSGRPRTHAPAEDLWTVNDRVAAVPPAPVVPPVAAPVVPAPVFAAPVPPEPVIPEAVVPEFVVEPDPVVALVPVAEPEPVVEPEAEFVAEAEIEPEFEVAVEPEPEFEVEDDAELEYEVETEAEVEPEVEFETDDAEDDVVTGLVLESDEESDEPGDAAELFAEDDDEAGDDAELVIEPAPGSEPEAELEAEDEEDEDDEDDAVADAADDVEEVEDVEDVEEDVDDEPETDEPEPAYVEPADAPEYVLAEIPRADESWDHYHGLAVSSSYRAVEVDGSLVDLTGTEFDLLSSLLSSGRRIRSRAEIAILIGGGDPAAHLNDAARRSADAVMGSLLAKLGENPAAPRWIEAVPGVGYRRTAR